MENCSDEARVVVGEWLRLVAMVGRDLDEGVVEVRRGEPSRAAAVLSRMAPRAREALARLGAVTASPGDAELGALAAEMARDYEILLAFSEAVAMGREPADVRNFNARVGVVLRSLRFDSRRLGEWLSEHCPELAESTLTAAGDLRL